jgi:hypothetical protein
VVSCGDYRLDGIATNSGIDRDVRQGLSLCVTLYCCVEDRFLPSLKIPDRFKPGIVVLGTLSEESFNQVMSSLSSAPLPPKGHKELNSWVASEIKDVTATDLKRVIETLVSLYRLRIKSKVEPEVLASDVVESASTEPSLKGLPSDLLRERLNRALTVTSLDLVDAKAKELQQEYERTFCDARIVTDLRPVFGGNVTDSPDTMIIVHTLKLGFHDSRGKHKDIFVSLDTDEIGQLIDVLKRALAKNKTLKGKMDAMGIQAADI